jgi:predicted lactoylglutathione lyase
MKSVEIIMIPVEDRQKAKEFYLKLGFQLCSLMSAAEN